MADTMGFTLVEFVEVSADRIFPILYGWPRASTPFTFSSNYGAAIRSVGWRPYSSWTAALLPTLIPQFSASDGLLIGILRQV